jgi:hypothetical protein
MKLIKIITAVVMSFGMMVAQGQGQGGNQDGNQGPPPCDEWLNSDMAHDMNGDGTVDENDCPQQGPDPAQQAFMATMQNGGTADDAFEAVAAVHHQMDVECDDCEMTEEEFQEGKAEAKAAFDAVLAVVVHLKKLCMPLWMLVTKVVTKVHILAMCVVMNMVVRTTIMVTAIIVILYLPVITTNMVTVISAIILTVVVMIDMVTVAFVTQK